MQGMEGFYLDSGAYGMRDNRGPGHESELPVLCLPEREEKSFKENESDRKSDRKVLYILASGHSHGLHC